MAGGGFSFISDLLRQSLGLEKEREWRRKDGYDEEGGGIVTGGGFSFISDLLDGYDEDGGGLVALGGFSSIFDLLRQSLRIEKEREWRRKDGYGKEGGG